MVECHRRIQDFVGGGANAPLPPPPGSAPDYCAAVNYLATQIHICEGVLFWGEGGGQGPLAPPPGSAPGFVAYILQNRLHRGLVIEARESHTCVLNTGRGLLLTCLTPVQTKPSKNCVSYHYKIRLFSRDLVT